MELGIHFYGDDPLSLRICQTLLHWGATTIGMEEWGGHGIVKRAIRSPTVKKRRAIHCVEGIQCKERPKETSSQREKEEATNVYDTFIMHIDHHWSYNNLEEMIERDW